MGTDGNGWDDVKVLAMDDAGYLTMSGKRFDLTLADGSVLAVVKVATTDEERGELIELVRQAILDAPDDPSYRGRLMAEAALRAIGL